MMLMAMHAMDVSRFSDIFFPPPLMIEPVFVEENTLNNPWSPWIICWSLFSTTEGFPPSFENYLIERTKTTSCPRSSINLNNSKQYCSPGCIQQRHSHMRFADGNDKGRAK